MAMREGWPHRPCRVARWSNIIKPLQWQLGQHAYCLSAAAQNLRLLLLFVVVGVSLNTTEVPFAPTIAESPFAAVVVPMSL